MSVPRLTAQDVRYATFGKPPWGQRGYNNDEVDAFLQLAASRLDGYGNLSVDDVHAVSFSKPPIGKRGYNEDEVDDFLEQLEATIASLDDRT
jgi:DivIVA domain-containing protein